MVEVNEELTRKVSHLARLALSEQEIRLFTAQLEEILDYVEKLQEVDVNGVEPLFHPVELEFALREDVVVGDERSIPASRILQSAPEVLNDGFKVPPIL